MKLTLNTDKQTIMINNSNNNKGYTDDEIRDQIRNFYSDLEDKNTLPREKIKILFLDDEEKNLKSFKSLLRRDYEIDLANSSQEAFQLLKTKEFHIIITDQRMPDITGTEFLKVIVEKYPKPIRILLTGYADIEAVIDAINKGNVYRYMTKPWEEEDMKQTIHTAYEVFLLRERNKKLLLDMSKANSQLEYLLRHKLLDQDYEDI